MKSILEPNKPVTLDDLAAMIATGFNDTSERMATKEDLANFVKEIQGEILKINQEIESLRNSVNNYLRLSDECYLNLKRRQDVIVSWVTKIAEKNGIAIDVKELEDIPS
jgi:hypothetical protein